MEASHTVWPCPVERRVRRTQGWCVSSQLPVEKVERYYGASLRRASKYIEHGNGIDRMRKQLVASLAELIADQDIIADSSRDIAVDVRTVAEKFHEQSDIWKRETSYLSSPLQKMSHPSYQAIMGMASESPEIKRQVIREMLLEILKDRRDWYLALSFLTQQNPVQQRDYGIPSKLAEAWIKWGKSQGLL